MKKNVILYSLIFLISGFLWQGCEEEEIEKYKSEASLYFYNGAYSLDGDEQDESISYSFFYTESDVMQDTVWVDVRLTGFLSEEDRFISLVQLNTEDEDAAIAGTHYVAFKDPEYSTGLVMPSGENAVLIPIVIKKTDDMESNKFTLEFGFDPNENFVAGLINQSTFTVTMTSMAVKPESWDYYYDYTFGEWGQVKMRFLIDYVGFTDFTLSLDSYDYSRYYNMKARELLAEYEQENGLLYENDGVTRVVFP